MKKEKMMFFIVDDDPFSAAIFRQYLIFEGYRNIHVFNNGKDCLDSMHEEPDVIILDHFMAPVNGIEVLKKVKETNPGIYVIYASTSADAGLISSSLQKGAFCYIIKGENDLANMVRELRNIEDAIKLLKYSSVKYNSNFPLTYNRNAFFLS